MDAKVARERVSVRRAVKYETAQAELEEIFDKIRRAADNGSMYLYHTCQWMENYDKLRELGYRVEIKWPILVGYIDWAYPTEN
jgi:hypothetical protein